MYHTHHQRRFRHWLITIRVPTCQGQNLVQALIKDMATIIFIQTQMKSTTTHPRALASFVFRLTWYVPILYLIRHSI